MLNEERYKQLRREWERGFELIISVVWLISLSIKLSPKKRVSLDSA